MDRRELSEISPKGVLSSTEIRNNNSRQSTGPNVGSSFFSHCIAVTSGSPEKDAGGKAGTEGERWSGKGKAGPLGNGSRWRNESTGIPRRSIRYTFARDPKNWKTKVSPVLSTIKTCRSEGCMETEVTIVPAIPGKMSTEFLFARDVRSFITRKFADGAHETIAAITD